MDMQAVQSQPPSTQAPPQAAQPQPARPVAPSAPVTLADCRTITDPFDGIVLVSPRDAARLLGLSKRTMYYWISRGYVEVRRLAGGPGGGRMMVVAETLIKEAVADAQAFR